jgi:hypothetical protein
MTVRRGGTQCARQAASREDQDGRALRKPDTCPERKINRACMRAALQTCHLACTATLLSNPARALERLGAPAESRVVTRRKRIARSFRPRGSQSRHDAAHHPGELLAIEKLFTGYLIILEAAPI